MSSLSSTTYALEMIRINKSFGPVIALDDVSLKVKVGTVHGLIGQNGAGKSTAMNALFGLIHLRAGHVTLDGADITGAAGGLTRH